MEGKTAKLHQSLLGTLTLLTRRLKAAGLVDLLPDIGFMKSMLTLIERQYQLLFELTHYGGKVTNTPEFMLDYVCQFNFRMEFMRFVLETGRLLEDQLLASGFIFGMVERFVAS